jgi:ATP adenylyltransferase
MHGMGRQRSTSCPLCELIGSGASERRLGSAAAVPDAFPVSSGHTVVVPARHVADFFALSAEEQGPMSGVLSRRFASILNGGSRRTGSTLG